MKLGERGGRRRDFHDAGVNTRHAMEHVKESKSGLSSFQINVHQHIQQMYILEVVERFINDSLKLCVFPQEHLVRPFS